MRQPLLLVLSLAGLVRLGPVPQAPGGENGPTTEPALRARVTLAGEEIEVALGRPGRTADGREILVELLPDRTFRLDGSFELSYPRDWTFCGSVGAPTPVDGWWNLAGEGQMIHLRRHGGDAREVLLEYVGNLELLGGTGREAVSLVLDGRALAGYAVEQDVGSVRGPSRRWVQEVFAWSEGEGASWLMAVQRELALPSPLADPALLVIDVIVQDAGDPPPAVIQVPTPPEPTSSSMLGGFRWK